MLWNEVWLVCLVSGSVAHQLLNADTLQTLIQCGVWGCVFSTVCTRSHCAYKVCFQQLFYKQSNKKQNKKLHTCQSHFWCTAASKHNWTPHHIILHKCQERWGQGDPVHLNCRAQNIVLGLFAAGGASQTVPSDLRLKLDQLHTSLPSHTAICPRFFFLPV